MSKKYPDLVDLIERGTLKPRKEYNPGPGVWDDTPPSQWDEIAMPNIIEEDEVSDAEIQEILREARLKLLKKRHQERTKK